MKFLIKYKPINNHTKSNNNHTQKVPHKQTHQIPKLQAKQSQNKVYKPNSKAKHAKTKQLTLTAQNKQTTQVYQPKIKTK